MKGLLLVNLGTPDEASPEAVKRYLREFLSDPKVLDINPIGRFLLLNLIILPKRPKLSAEAYQKIWTEKGSPLLLHSQDLREKVARVLGDDWHVELAMRYGRPDMSSAIERLRARGVERLVVLPLYPQNADSSTGSTIARFEKLSGELQSISTIVPAFYDQPGFIEAFAVVGKPFLKEDDIDHVLFSFHGLPERHMKKGDPSGQHCLIAKECCASIGEHNRDCYRAQSFATARSIADLLGLHEQQYTVSFQSRLGRTPWIKPYTDEILPELAERGIKKLLVYCPAFVADCLETTEEIGMRAKDQWTELGGETLTLVPSLNSSAPWVEFVADIARKHAALD